MAKTPRDNGNGTTPANDNGNGNGNGTALAVGITDELAGMEFGDNFDDGMSEAAAEHFQPTVYAINQNGTDKSGRAIPKDVFFNSTDETTHSEVDAVLCYLHIVNRYQLFNESTKKNDTICRSDDRVVGTMSSGVVRPCKGCPDAEWKMVDDKDGKPVRRRACADVWNVGAINTETGQPFLVKFKKTSLPVFKSYLAKHHRNRRMVNGKPKNYPLFSFGVKLSAKMASAKATYAVPVLERTRILSRDEINLYGEMALMLKSNMTTLIEKADALDEAGGATDATDFDTEKYATAAGQDFVETPEPQGA